MRTVKWQVDCLATPTIIRHCKKCHRDTEFICSDMFRVNAQKKNLDIWLIYNCEQCKTSWNATIFSRTNSNKFDPELLNLFLKNDPQTVKKYGLDKTTLKKNGVQIKKIDYEIVGEKFLPSESVRLEISSDVPLDIKLSVIIKRKLELSNLEFKQLFINSRIEKQKGIVRKKLTDKITVLLNLEEANCLD
ncbi:DUF1062 domain-containing protein [Enterococcus sp. AZ109]|uniref:DUF1062 domain-containing protein n=1 Tax=Enterococcus sp. AZ109 TaxID=2774634 RepID=UPI003F248561